MNERSLQMISRYTRPEVGKIWTDQRKYETWLEIELLACEALSELGEIPPEAVREIKEKASLMFIVWTKLRR